MKKQKPSSGSDPIKQQSIGLILALFSDPNAESLESSHSAQEVKQNPPPTSKKNITGFPRLLQNALIVFIVFMVVDYIWYGWLAPQPGRYSSALVPLLSFTLVFAFVFAHMYDRASVWWRPDSPKPYISTKHKTPEYNPKATTLSKIANGMLYSALIVLACLAAAGLVFYMTSLGNSLDINCTQMYSMEGVVVLVTKAVLSGAAVEKGGNSEDDNGSGKTDTGPETYWPNN